MMNSPIQSPAFRRGPPARDRAARAEAGAGFGGAGDEPVRVEDAHRSGKPSQRRCPSPTKGARAPRRDIAELLEATSLEGGDEGVGKVMDVVDTAQAFVEANEARKAEFKKATAELPLLLPGNELKKQDAQFGFRVHEDSVVEMSSAGNFRVLERKCAPKADEAVQAIVLKYQSGFAWCYWANSLVGPEKKPLASCLTEYGTAVIDKGNGLFVKGVFLTKQASTRHDKFFVLAVVLNGDQITASGQEKDDTVFRVFRSKVPLQIREVIDLHQLVCLRNESKKASFWEM